MLNIRACPGKPQYSMASEHSLLLFDCAFEDVKWTCNIDTHKEILAHFQDVWASKTISTIIVQEAIHSVNSHLVVGKDDKTPAKWSDLGRRVYGQLDSYIPGLRKHSYQPLLDRPSADTLEVKLGNQEAKRLRQADPGTSSR
eukprot:m.139764 g.139764  ORF g.139764 m.139764 type:complete len:142 (+) comp38280_c2_seq27:1106-1531(+)